MMLKFRLSAPTAVSNPAFPNCFSALNAASAACGPSTNDVATQKNAIRVLGVTSPRGGPPNVWKKYSVLPLKEGSAFTSAQMGGKVKLKTAVTKTLRSS